MEFSILLCAIVVFIVTVIIAVYFKLIRPEKYIYDVFRTQGVPGEPFVPLLGQIPDMIKRRNNDEFMKHLEELEEKHGKTFLFGFGPLTRLICNDPDILADLLSRNNAMNYDKPKDFITMMKPMIGRHNLLLSGGAEHERARRMLNPAFHHLSIKSMISIIADRTTKAIQSLLIDKQQPVSVDLLLVFNALTVSIIASSAFGADFETNAHAKDIIARRFGESLDAIEYRSMRGINQIPFLSRLPFWRKPILDSGMRQVSEFVDQIVTDRRQGKSTSMSSGADLLDLLLSAVDSEGRPFTDLEIKEQSLTFVAAGSETTGNLMTWMLYVLMTHESVLQACREEIDRVLPDNAEPTDENLSKLVVCEAVINETLRLYPPAPFMLRESIRDHTIGSDRPLRIPKGAVIIINSYVIHRRSDLWPRALEFDYTRWIRDPKTGLKPKLPHPFAYLPFAAGPRNCIGQNFALLEAKIMLVMFVQRCNFEMIPGQKIAPDVKITMRPKYGLWAKVSQRQM